MSGDIEIDDPDVSDGDSENEYSDHEIGREEDENTDMVEQKFVPDDEENGTAGESIVTAKPKLDPKDPLRPRRKKARRACFACQRAHLTCGKFIYVGRIFSKDIGPVFLSPVPPRHAMSYQSTMANTMFNRRRTSVSTLHKTRSCGCLPRWREEEGEVSS